MTSIHEKILKPKPGLLELAKQPEGVSQACKVLGHGRGCCPGQTGHHLLPEAMFKNCPGYGRAQHNRAPVVCAEGVNHSQGSHGQLHTALDEVLRQNHGQGQPMSINQAMDHAVESMNDSRVGRHCRDECLKEQLRQFYDSLPCTPEAIDSRGNQVGPDVTEDL